ncbi:MAG: carbohydrate porin [Thiotrichales bacterium]|nr:MAG: carbohydrate porin [Thiotrichales bacterium]
MSTKKILISFVLGASIAVFESAAEEKSAYDDIPEFGGPGSVGVDLKEENKPAPTGDFIKDLMPGWFEAKERAMNDYGLGYGINYSTLYQKANNSVGEDQAWGGMLQLPASWTVMNNKDKGSSGTFVFKLENRHKIATDLAPQDLGLGTFGPGGVAGLGAVSIVGTQFSDKGWILTNLYWQHKTRDGKLNYVVGQIDNTDFLDLYGLINPQTAFMNLNFSTNPSIGIPDQGFGGYGGIALSDNFYVVAGLMDAGGSPDKPGESLSDFFDKNEYFKHIEIGYTTTFERRYFDNIHFVYWESDAQTNDQGAVTEAKGSGWTFSAAHFFQDKYMPFLRYGDSDGGGGALNEKVLSVGFGIYDWDSGELFSIGLSKSTPSSLTIAPGLNDQYTAEVFYRFMLSKHFAITPDLQYIKDPALNPNDSSIWIAGIRARLTL